MAEVGSASVAIVPTFNGFRSKLGAEADGAGKESGSRFASSFKGLVGPAIALAGSGIFAGFIAEAAKASDATDKFVATMDFAGLDTKAIDAAKTSAKEYADATVYDLPTIQNMIAQLASNGVKDYTGLTKAAGNLNAVAGGNADTFKSVAMVMTQTAGAGKLTTENWNQLSDAIPGAAGPLMKAMEGAGAYTGNFRDAMAAGAITSDEFNAALMKLGMNKTAVEAAKSTKTFEGAIGNLQATINSGLMSALDALKPAITGAINLLSNGLGKSFEFVGKAGKGLYDLFAKGDFTSSLREAFNVQEDSAFVDFLFRIRDAALGLRYLFTKGNFSGMLGRAFNVEEDSKFVGFLFRVRDAALEVRGGLLAFGAAWKANDGDVTSAGFAGVMERIANGLREATGGVRAFFAAFKAGDGDLTSSGFAGFMEGLGNSARQLFDTLGPAIAALLPQIVSLWSAFSPLQVIFAAIQPLLPQLGAMFGQLASTIGGTLSSVLTGVLPMIMQLSALISQSLGQVLAAVLPAAVQMITMLGATLSQLLPIIMPIIGTIVQLATTLISQLAPIITNLVTAILPPVVSIFGNILSVIGPVISMVAGLLIPIIQALMPVVVTVFGVVANVIASAMQIIQGIIQVVTGIITGNWQQVWDGLGNIVSGTLNTIGSVLGGLFDIVMSAIGNIGGWLVDSGKALIQGFIDGISGMVGAIGDAVGGVLGAVADFFPHSPAKKGPFSGKGYTTHSGKALATDFAKSIAGEQGTVAGAASKLMTAATLTGSVNATGAATAAGGVARGGAQVNVTMPTTERVHPADLARALDNRLNYVLRSANA